MKITIDLHSKYLNVLYISCPCPLNNVLGKTKLNQLSLSNVSEEPLAVLEMPHDSTLYSRNSLLKLKTEA